MLADSYLVSKKTKSEIVTQMRQTKRTGIKNRYSTYKIETNRKERNFNNDVFNNVSVGDTININCSSLTGTLQTLSITRDSNKKIFNIGFINTSIGLAFISLAFLLMLIYILLSITKYKFDKNATTIGILIVVVFVIIQHFRY